MKETNLFIKEAIFSIESINKFNYDRQQDSIFELSQLLQKHEINYPDILYWFKNKVLQGIKNGNRIAYIGKVDSLPIASAILKIGENAKFCHLHIEPEYHNYNLGELFFTLMTVDTKRIAKEIYFTLPESLWYEKKDFFVSFGFNNISNCNKIYRNGDSELVNYASLRTVWENVLNKLPKLISQFSFYHDDIQNGILLSIKPEYFEKIKKGEKTIEIRKEFNKNLKGCKAILYSSKPYQEIHGFVTIENVEKNSPDIIWEKYKEKIACSEHEYFNYTQDNKQIYSIFLRDYKSYLAPIPLSQLSHLTNSALKPPQSYYRLGNNITWANAISVSEFLHKRFKINLHDF